MYKYTLSNEGKQLIRTTSPDRLLDLDAGTYTVDDTVKNILRELWESVDDYAGTLTLEVENG